MGGRFAMGLNLSKKARMFAAIERGDIKKVRKMLDTGYNPDWAKFSGKCALLVAVIENKKDIAELLIARGASFSANYYHEELGETRHETLLHVAASLGHKDIVKLLLAQDGYDHTLLNRLDGSRNTALHLAAANGHADVVTLLLEAGFDHSLKGANGKLPVGYAFQGKHQAVVELISARQQQLEATKAPVAAPAVPAAPLPGAAWKLVSPQSVAHLSAMDELGYKITDVFNFASRERIRIVNNIKTRADNVVTTPFEDLRPAQIEEAKAQLEKLGGQLAGEDAATKKRLPPPSA